eukprot:15438942-Alexandrium_andersonii.AAC.1
MVTPTGARVAPGNTAAPATSGFEYVPGPVTWPVVHAGLAIPNLWVIVWITALAYFSSAGPVVARAPVLAAWTCAAAA